MSSLKTALIQTSSGIVPSENAAFIGSALREAAENGAELAILPECALLWAKTDITHKESRSLEDWEKIILPIIKKHGIATVWGGIQIKEEEGVFNTSLAYDESGKLLCRYEKTHLFQLFMKDKMAVDETETYRFGRTGPQILEFKGFKFGISICYDLRFPELYRQYENIDALICTAAFTKKTGRAHWELLLRARAVENQCYMLAAAQCGINKANGIHTYGHSMAVDSWGKILAEAGDSPEVIFSEISRKHLDEYREQLPALKNRRLK